jgi:hypothetical protein
MIITKKMHEKVLHKLSIVVLVQSLICVEARIFFGDLMARIVTSQTFPH